MLFRIYKPKGRLKPSDEYKTKPELAVELIREIHALGFVIERVLADSLYGEAGAVIRLLEQELHLPYIVAIRSNHGRMMMPGQRIRYNRWRAYDQPLANHPTQQRYIREIIFAKRWEVRYFQISKGATDTPERCDRWSIMTNLPGKIILTVGRQYSWRNWIEYGFKQVKNELGWHDYRLTDYASIERWWELIFLAYMLVSLQAEAFKRQPPGDDGDPTPANLPFAQHPHWEAGCNWKSALNNLRLILQPYCSWARLELWLQVLPIPGLQRAMQRLMQWMDTYRIRPSPQQQQAAA